MKSLFKCISCNKTQGGTQIKIKSSCFDKPIIINISSEDNQLQIIQELLNNLSNLKEVKNGVIPEETIV